MTARVDLTLFAHIVSQPEADLDLAQAALLIAEAEHPNLDIPRYLRRLDELGAQARRRASAAAAPEGGVAIQTVLALLYQELGFRGNTDEYYDPRNSYLNEVLDRRTGIPITLAVVLLEVARRAGIEAQGIAFPGHFLVRVDDRNAALILDPFEGRVLSQADLRELYARTSGESRDPDPHHLKSASKQQILMRLLNNLRTIHTRTSDIERLRRVLERMDVLAPTQALQRELAALGGGRPWPSSGHTLH